MYTYILTLNIYFLSSFFPCFFPRLWSFCTPTLGLELPLRRCQIQTFFAKIRTDLQFPLQALGCCLTWTTSLSGCHFAWEWPWGCCVFLVWLICACQMSLKNQISLGLSVQCLPDLKMSKEPEVSEKAWKLWSVRFVVYTALKNYKI